MNSNQLPKINVFLVLLLAMSFVTSAAAQRPSPDTHWTYKKIDGKKLKLSVFLPDGYESGTQFPTIVIFHGGSWRAGEASWHFPDCAYWSQRGMIAVSVDYRLKERDGVKVPLECVKDAKSAIRYLRKNAEELKVDVDKLVAAGGSAGGQLAAATATITDKEINDDCFDLSISCVPSAVVLWNPWFRCEDSLCPPKHVVEGLPPMITFSGGKDPGIPVVQMQTWHEQLKSKGNTSLLFIGNEGKHGLCNGRNRRNPFFYWSLDLIDTFLVEHGILTGDSMVKIPDGVKKLSAEDYEAFE